MVPVEYFSIFETSGMILAYINKKIVEFLHAQAVHPIPWASRLPTQRNRKKNTRQQYFGRLQ